MTEALVHTFRSERERLDSTGYECTRLGMSNFDHTIDDGFETALRSGKVYGRYAGWNFNGAVWFDGSQFACEVWVYRSPREVVYGATLMDLMRDVSARYGSD